MKENRFHLSPQLNPAAASPPKMWVVCGGTFLADWVGVQPNSARKQDFACIMCYNKED
jgi:hypothetical protein